jgi:hypothetical protein
MDDTEVVTSMLPEIRRRLVHGLRIVAALAVVALVVACASSQPVISCEPPGGDVSECFAVAAAAAKVAPANLVPGSRAEVTNLGTWWHVVFIVPSGHQASADVVWSPLGKLAGVNGADGP